MRVGIDSADVGHWNAPADLRSHRFVYVPIVETKPLRLGMERFYEEVEPALVWTRQSLPLHLRGQKMHLDPDFQSLTYGDQGRRAEQIQTLKRRDLLVFYGSLRDLESKQLVYAIIGLFVIDHIACATSVPRSLWPNNAHTRRVPKSDDIVVVGLSKLSGRCESLVEIGEYRSGAYRVRPSLLQAWGGLTIRDGYLQRSARLPEFNDARRFYRWFTKQRVQFLRCNN